MAGKRELTVSIKGETKQFEQAMGQAARSTEALQKDLTKLGSKKTNVDVQMKTDRINRDLKNLNVVLDQIERRKANPDVGFDLVQLRRDEARVRREIERLEKEKVDIEVDLDVTGADQVTALLGQLDSITGGRIRGLSTITAGLGKLGTTAGGTAVAIGGVAAGTVALGAAVEAGVISLGRWAAAAESTRLSLQLLSGSDEGGARLFDELNTYADKTPFLLDEVTGSARRLLAVGVPLSAIPDEVQRLGDVAALSGISIERVALIFTQMVAKGKVSAEEMNQLAEAGINGWGALSEATGLTVAELQELSKNSKLGAESVAQLWDVLGERAFGATAKQAETLEGKLSTLEDSIARAKRELGELALEPAKESTDALTSVADGVGDIAEATSKMNEESGGLISNVFGYLLGWKQINGILGGTGDALSYVGESAQGTEVAVGNAVGEFLNLAPAIEEVTEEVKPLTAALDALNGAFITEEEATSRRKSALESLVKTLGEERRLTRESKDAIIDSSKAITDEAIAMRDNGATREEVQKFIRRQREALLDAAEAAGISREKAEEYIDELGLIPSEVTTNIYANTDDALTGIEKLKSDLDNLPVFKEINLTVKAKLGNLYQAERMLDADLNGNGAIGYSVGAGTGGVPTVRSVMGSGTARAGSSYTLSASLGGNRTVLAPQRDTRQPINVYLDGRQIASYLEPVSSSGNRRP